MTEFTPDLLLVLAAGFLAGVVRGFSGFGTSLMFVPLAGRVIPPAEAVVMIALVDSLTALALLPRAVRVAEHGKVFTLAIGAAIGIPFGAYALATLDTTLLRWILSVLVAMSILVLATGWRYRRTPTRPAAIGIGALAGVMGGIGGLFGPAVMLFMMGSNAPSRILRANIIVFLGWVMLAAGVAFLYLGLLRWDLVLRSAVLLPVFGLGVLIGAKGFGHASEKHYQIVAYVVIGIAAVLGLPVLDQVLH